MLWVHNISRNHRAVIDKGKAIIVSMSPQSRASLAVHFGISALQVLVADPFENPLVKGFYDEWLEVPGSETAKKFLHTAYHPVVRALTDNLSSLVHCLLMGLHFAVEFSFGPPEYDHQLLKQIMSAYQLPNE
ncbi:hypothetical protein GH714_016672 [Hevea brasiliensis]|uniref:Iron hydrogenase small subunit domain-containing protein n=1 Tax=Hevea brasiliensis TaxID=3981 RepID=A0A6A6KIS4_HEVBR|nr:hypothetical protein GH714_016672 [Hevea brasiliensis]